MGRGSIFGHALNTPAPNLYSTKSASQEIKIKPNMTKSINIVKMNRQGGTLKDRSLFLYSKHSKEYELGYQQKIQINNDISTLNKKPVVKIGKYVDRDKVTHNKEVAAIMNQQEFEVSEKRRQFELKIAEEEFRVAQLIKKLDSGVVTDLMPNEIASFSKKKAYNMRPLYPNVE